MKMQKLATRLEIKAADSATGEIEGFGSVFGERDSYGDVVLPGAFKESLSSGRKVKMLFQHDPSMPIGVWDTLEEDQRGLRVKGRLAVETSKGADVAAMLRMDVIDGLSIGYRTPAGGSEWDEEKQTLFLKNLELWEVSIVTFPANSSALIDGVKSIDEIDALDMKGVERFLREAENLSREAIKRLLHRHSHLVVQREAAKHEAAKSDELSRTIASTLERLKSL